MIGTSLLFLQLLSPAYAAQYATVNVDQTEIHDVRNTSGKVIEKLKKGTVVAASNQTLDNFYKVRTLGGVVGWVSAQDLVLSGKNSLPPASGSTAPSEVSAEPIAEPSAE